MTDTSSKNLENGRVIVTYGRSLMALIAAHSLGRKGVEIIGGDSINNTVTSYSRYTRETFVYTDPEKDEEQYLKDIVKIVEQFRPEEDRPYVLMPVFKDTRLIARHKDRFEGRIIVATPDIEAIDRVHPKHSLAETLKDLDVPSPQTWLPESREELEQQCGDMDFPVIMKPYNEAGGRGIARLNNVQEVLAHWDLIEKDFGQKALVQEAVSGKDYCLSAIFDDGELKGSMAYTNVYTFPSEAGAGVLRESVEDERFAEIAQELMGPLDWNGIAEFDFIWDEDPEHEPKLLEVNTRFWGGLFQSVESGIDFPWLLYKLSVTGHIVADEIDEPEIGVRTKMPFLWIYSALKDVLDNDEKRQEIEAKGEQALARFREGDYWQSLKDYGAYLADALGYHLDFGRHSKQMRAALDIGRDARREILDTDDPYAAFGVLFIVDSLIRHGHLPHELKL